MGRRTWESIGKPLPNRLNIVITQQQSYAADGATIVHSLEEARAAAGSERIFVIGGGEIYKEAIEFATKLHITRIHSSLEGDAFFPEFDLGSWSCDASTNRPADENNRYDLTFEIWSVAH